MNSTFLIAYCIGFPLAAGSILILWGSRLPRKIQTCVGVGASCVSCVLSGIAASDFLRNSMHVTDGVQTLVWKWITVKPYEIQFLFRLDSISLCMMAVITFVGSLIFLFSAGYMKEDSGYHRFFAYLNFFLASMLTLVLADDFVVLFLGWEGVGLCSYLLIGFWFTERKNIDAARKAFIVTRIADAALLIGILLLITLTGTSTISQVLKNIASFHDSAGFLIKVIAFLLLIGALGKSAQVPLQVWLPDAMAGPTPVSALIHAATMVTAGVYLLARTHAILSLVPFIHQVILCIGIATILISGFSALVQRDLKRILAYSTISQIGYMFVAIGVGAYTASLFHFAMHAIFKALLFLSAGVLIHASHHKQDIFEMDISPKTVPLAFFAFLIGAASLSSFPLITAGFWSKDVIITQTWAYAKPFGLIALFGDFLTALYAFRPVMILFYRRQNSSPKRTIELSMSLPLYILSIGAIVAGYLNVSAFLPGLHGFELLFAHEFGAATTSHELSLKTEILIQVLAGSTSIGGIFCAFCIYGLLREKTAVFRRSPMKYITGFFTAGWGFDSVYRFVIVKPFTAFSSALSPDQISLYDRAITKGINLFSQLFTLLQTGNMRFYAASIALGCIIMIALGVL